jgi:hypothetical protein
MPLIGHERSLPAVLAEGVLNREESEALIRFYNNARAFNLCLDYCHDALLDRRLNEDPNRLDKEVRRTRIKAAKLAPSDAKETQYDDAIEIIAKNLPRGSLQQLTFDSDEPGD